MSNNRSAGAPRTTPQIVQRRNAGVSAPRARVEAAPGKPRREVSGREPAAGSTPRPVSLNLGDPEAMDEGAPHTHWVDGRLVDEHARPREQSPWVRLLAVLFMVVCVDLALGLAPEGVHTADPNPSSSANVRTALRGAAEAASEGRRAVVLVGDSVLAGDVMASEVPDWRSQRVVDHMRTELSPDSDAELRSVALDALLPIDALPILAELDRLDPAGEVELVLEINLRYFSASYGTQDSCSRDELCELGHTALAGGSPLAPDAGTFMRAAVGLAEAAGLAHDWLLERTPIHRHREQLEHVELDEVEGLAVRREQAQQPEAEPAPTPSEDRRAEGLARVREHYRSSAIVRDHAQVQAVIALLDRLAARGRRATLFLTPLDNEFARTTLPGNHLGRRHEQLARIVNDHPAGSGGRVQLLDLDHPLFESHHFLDHVHLRPAGNRLLALNLLHELALPMATRPEPWMMVHGEDHDRTLIHRRGIGFADGGPWEALLRMPQGVAVSRDGGRVVIADTGNHVLRQLRGNMQFLERLAGKPRKAGVVDGPALAKARLARPHSPALLGERVYFIDGTNSDRVRELSGGFVRTLSWEGTSCPRYDALVAGVLDGREWLYLLCRNDRIVSVDLAAARGVLTSDPRAPVLADSETGAPRGYTAIEVSDDGRLFFADGGAKIWAMKLRDDGRAREPELVFANEGEEDLPNEFKRTYPFRFDEMRVRHVAAMEWVERYDALLIQDQHEVKRGNERLHRQLTERVHLRLLDFERQQILPWVKAIPHGDAWHMWNAKSRNYVSYYHLGSMAVAQDDASLVWVERMRSRVFRLADGMLGVEKYGNLHTTWSKVEFLNTIGTQTSSWVGTHLRPDRFLDRRHEPIPHRGPYVALMVNSSLSTISDRIGNYSLGRLLENELQAELGYRDNVRLDLFQRTAGAAAFKFGPSVFEEFVRGNGPPPDVAFIELHDFNYRFFRGTKTRAERIAVLGKLERLASYYDTLVLFYDNSAMVANDRDGMRHTHKALRELIADAKKLGFVVLEPSDRLLRELLVESPWGSQPWGPSQHHGAPWAIELTAKVLAQMSYPVIREHLRGREPARLSERDPASFTDTDAGEPLAEALAATEKILDLAALPQVPPAYIQRSYEDRQARIFVDLGGVKALGRSEAELRAIAIAVIHRVLVEEAYGELATQVSVDLVEFENYDEYGEGVLESANSVWTRSFDRRELEQFIRDFAGHRRKGGR
jgi:hypothetical protein